jgi:hypothetical protein
MEFFGSSFAVNVRMPGALVAGLGWHSDTQEVPGAVRPANFVFIGSALRHRGRAGCPEGSSRAVCVWVVLPYVALSV